MAGVEYDWFSSGTSAGQTLTQSQGFAVAASAKLASQGKAGFNFGGDRLQSGFRGVDPRIDVRESLDRLPHLRFARCGYHGLRRLISGQWVAA